MWEKGSVVLFAVVSSSRFCILFEAEEKKKRKEKGGIYLAEIRKLGKRYVLPRLPE